MADHTRWWQTGVIYQIYPRSFMDASGDGVGDLAGIARRLDYLAWLGVDAIWLSPIFPSPMADFGYDVANYTDVDPLFGDLAAFDRLLRTAHERGLKVVLDFVPNHSSDEHPWFVDARSSRESARRDWYIWRDPAPDGGPPNNWASYFGGPAWTFDAATGQYYLHLFHAKQPDLNWRNPAVRTAIYDAMRFWFDRGVDGFRLDVIWLLIKDAQFRDNPLNPDWTPADRPQARQFHTYTEDQPEVHEITREMRAIADAYDERVLIGEIYLPIPRLVTYYGPAPTLDELHLPFNFQLISAPWTAETVRRAIEDYEAALPPGGWPNWVLGNHDQPRLATRVGPEQARVAQMFLLTVRGTPTCYYGDEIAMHNVPIPPEMMHDPQGLASPAHSRDPERTPMQWDAGPNAGFAPPEATPWLPLAGDYPTRNVSVERDDPASTLSLFRRLIELRRAEPALTEGPIALVDAVSHANTLAYVREAAGRRILVALNLGASPQTLDLSAVAAHGEALCSTLMDMDRAGDRAGSLDLGTLALRPNEGLVLLV